MPKKLTPQQVLYIYHSKLPIKILTDMFNISTSSIKRIKHHHTWSDITLGKTKIGLNNGRPHQSNSTKNRHWCPNGCGKSVAGRYINSSYVYKCDRCNALYASKPDIV